VCGLSLFNFVGEIVANKRGEGFLGPVDGALGNPRTIYLSFVDMEFTEQDTPVLSKGSQFTVKCGLPPLSGLTEVFFRLIITRLRMIHNECHKRGR